VVSKVPYCIRSMSCKVPSDRSVPVRTRDSLCSCIWQSTAGQWTSRCGGIKWQPRGDINVEPSSPACTPGGFPVRPYSGPVASPRREAASRGGRPASAVGSGKGRARLGTPSPSWHLSLAGSVVVFGAERWEVSCRVSSGARNARSVAILQRWKAGRVCHLLTRWKVLEGDDDLFRLQSRSRTVHTVLYLRNEIQWRDRVAWPPRLLMLIIRRVEWH
jgi:hypothetical protein